MIEPEETIEAKIVALLAANLPSADVIGALSPFPEGDEKLAPDSAVSVFVDLASQDMDWVGPGTPCTWSVRIVLRAANADDASGNAFRDRARALRTALMTLLGDGCAALDGDGFSCDGFTLDSTATVAAGGMDGGMSKTYTATVKGRFTPPTETEEA